MDPVSKAFLLEFGPKLMQLFQSNAESSPSGPFKEASANQAIALEKAISDAKAAKTPEHEKVAYENLRKQIFGY